MRRRMSEISWLARSAMEFSSVECVGMARQRGDADVQVGEERESGEQLVQLVDGLDVEDADVRVAPGDAPEMRPPPVAVQRLRVLALAGLELLGLLRGHV